MDQALITKILDYLEAEIRKHPSMHPGIWLVTIEQRIRDWRAATENALRKLIGRPVGSLPNNLLELDGVRQPENLVDVVTGGAVGEAIDAALEGAGAIVTRGALLLGIVVLILLGGWKLFQEPSVVIQQVRRLGRAAA